MSVAFSTWDEVKARAAAVDPRPPADQEAGRGAAAERREAYVRGHQLAEMRKAVGLTQAQLAELLGVTQARISKIEHGEISVSTSSALTSARSAAVLMSSPRSATVAGRSLDGSRRALRRPT